MSLYLSISVVDAIFALSIYFVAFSGDKLLNSTKPVVLRAFVDSSTHTLIGAFSWAITSLHWKSQYNYEFVLAGFLSAFIDIDHFVKARSFYLRDAVRLGDSRPVLHCSTIPIVLILFGSYLARRNSWILVYRLICMGWIALTSHHIVDGHRRGLWFWPIGSTPPLRKLEYIALLIAVPYITLYLVQAVILKRPDDEAFHVSIA